MSFLSDGFDWFKRQFVSQDEIEDTPQIPSDTEEEPEAGALPVRSLHPLEVVVLTPIAYSNARDAADALKRGQVVIVILNDSVDDETASRFVDFMSGAVYYAGASIKLLNDDVLICAPDSVSLNEDKLAFVSGIPTWKGPDT